MRSQDDVHLLSLLLTVLTVVGMLTATIYTITQYYRYQEVASYVGTVTDAHRRTGKHGSSWLRIAVTVEGVEMEERFSVRKSFVDTAGDTQASDRKYGVGETIEVLALPNAEGSYDLELADEVLHPWGRVTWLLMFAVVFGWAAVMLVRHPKTFITSKKST